MKVIPSTAIISFLLKINAGQSQSQIILSPVDGTIKIATFNAPFPVQQQLYHHANLIIPTPCVRGTNFLSNLSSKPMAVHPNCPVERDDDIEYRGVNTGDEIYCSICILEIEKF